MNKLLYTTPDNIRFIDRIGNKQNHFSDLIVGLFETVAPVKTKIKGKRKRNAAMSSIKAQAIPKNISTRNEKNISKFLARSTKNANGKIL